MIIVNNETIKENVAELRLHIQLDSLNGVKDIIESNGFSNDEKIHLIQSQFIVENAEMKQLDQEIKHLEAIGAFFLGSAEDRCAMCDGSCEQAAPEGQMTIFDFLGPEPNQGQGIAFMGNTNPFANIPDPSEPPSGPSNEVPNALPKEILEAIGTMQELTNTVLAAFGK